MVKQMAKPTKDPLNWMRMSAFLTSVLKKSAHETRNPKVAILVNKFLVLLLFCLTSLSKPITISRRICTIDKANDNVEYYAHTY